MRPGWAASADFRGLAYIGRSRLPQTASSRLCPAATAGKTVFLPLGGLMR